MSRLLSITGLGALLLSVGAATAQQGPNALPDAPQPPSASSQQSGSQAGQNSLPIATAPSILTAPIPVPLGQLGLKGKFSYYIKEEFGPSNFLIPAAGALFRMANPPDHYPRAWKDGGGAFGRNYGDGLAIAFSSNSAKFVAGAMLREEPRYFPSENAAFGARVFHALKFTIIDKADSGRDRVAISNFAGAASGGFVGIAYLPPGYDDATHAGQRSLVAMGALAAQYEAAEFRPEIRAVLKKMHVPFIK